MQETTQNIPPLPAGIDFNTKLKGRIAFTESLDSEDSLLRDKSLYKFIWVEQGRIVVEIDHIDMELTEGEIVPLSPLQHIEFKAIEGAYRALLFNSNFYCIFGHDDEVSCNGLLFNGTSHILTLKLSAQERAALREYTGGLASEYAICDSLQEEMLRILLKRIIIFMTRIARRTSGITREKEYGFEIIRQYYVLVDQHFKNKKQVFDYADMLHRSPKTLSNLFLEFGMPSPLRVIHERIEAEAKRLLLYSQKSAKEIAYILGFEELASFSRFFKNMTGENITGYRRRMRNN